MVAVDEERWEARDGGGREEETCGTVCANVSRFGRYQKGHK